MSLVPAAGEPAGVAGVPRTAGVAGPSGIAGMAAAPGLAAVAAGQVTRRYLQQCLEPPAPLRRAVVDAPLPEEFVRSAGGRLLARPLLVPRDELDRAVSDVTACFDLLLSLPERLFDGDLERYCAALGMHPRRAGLLASLSHGPPLRYGRADLYHDGAGFRLLEFNVASNLGGVYLGDMDRALLRVPAFAAFADRHGLSTVDPAASLAACLREAASGIAVADPVVALLVTARDLENYADVLPPIRSALGHEGLDVLVGDVCAVRVRGGKPELGGRPFDVALRYFHIDHLLEDAAVHDAAMALDSAARAGTVAWWTPPDSSLYSHKGCMALLSDPRWRPAFSGEETALLDRLLPETRVLGGGTAGDEFVATCRREREQWIVKPFAEASGVGIVAGWEVPASTWERTLEGFRDQGYVAQRRVLPRPEPVVDPDTGALEDWVAPVGLFITPQGYAGAFVRALRQGDGAVVNYYRNPEVHIGTLYTCAPAR